MDEMQVISRPQKTVFMDLPYTKFVGKIVPFESGKPLRTEKLDLLYTYFTNRPIGWRSKNMLVCTICDHPAYRGKLVLLDGYHMMKIAARLWYEHDFDAPMMAMKSPQVTFREAQRMFEEYGGVIQ